MTTVFWIWMAAAVVFLIIELATPTFIMIGFVVGAIVAGIYGETSPDSYAMQFGLFLIVSLVLLPFTRKLASKITKPAPQVSNVDRMVGQAAVVTKAIVPDEGGLVRFEGEVWSAESDQPFAEHDKVRILSVTGTRVQVEQYNEEEERNE